jgi:hypothetical protein
MRHYILQLLAVVVLGISVFCYPQSQYDVSSGNQSSTVKSTQLPDKSKKSDKENKPSKTTCEKLQKMEPKCSNMKGVEWAGCMLAKKNASTSYVKNVIKQCNAAGYDIRD